jgi:hypothetical protein
MKRGAWFLIVVMAMTLPVLTVPGGVVAQGGNTIHACLNPAGQIRIVGAPGSCRHEESSLDWSRGSTAGAPTAIFDAGGKKVGNVVGILGGAPFTMGVPLVALEVGDHTPVLGALRTRLCAIEGSAVCPPVPEVMFESVDCTGQAFVSATPGGLPLGGDSILPIAVVAGLRDTLFVAPPDAVAREALDGSRLRYREACRPGSGISVAGFVPADTTVDLIDEFTPPFDMQ